ncbi:MAG: hypothetical protein KF900_00115 [Bacteroidetes bacterium]|nr:hypothetical protein [Bacteroidota bacterium]
MKSKALNKNTILKSVAKLAADKELVRSYLKGNVPVSTLHKKGIKFAKPL